MIDIETLDTKATSIIVSVGAVYFDLETGKLGDKFYAEVPVYDLEYQALKGRSFSFYTMSWWMSQGDEVRQVFSEYRLNSEQTRVSSLDTILKDLRFFIEGEPNIWANGSDFDSVILDNAFKMYGLETPWQFYQNRCYRTVLNIGDNKKKGLPRDKTTHHNSLADADYQARNLIHLIGGVMSHTRMS